MIYTDQPDVMSFFNIVDNSMVFTGEKLYIKIPSRYSSRDLLFVSDEIRTIGIFQMIINDNYVYNLLIPGFITIIPSKIYKEKIQDIDYVICELYKSDKLMKTIDILKEDYLPYSLYMEFISLGNLPDFLNYDDSSLLFIPIQNFTGVNLKANQTVWEMIYSHLYRDPDNLFKEYRHLDNRKKKPVFIGMNSVSFGPDSTTSKLMGSYFSDGINSALVNASDQHYDLEDLLRK